MKLHIPRTLRAALLACIAAVSPVATTLSTTSLICGTLTYSLLAPQALADTYEREGDSTNIHEGTWTPADGAVDFPGWATAFANGATNVMQFGSLATADHVECSYNVMSFSGIITTSDAALDTYSLTVNTASRNIDLRAVASEDVGSSSMVADCFNIIAAKNVNIGSSDMRWVTATLYGGLNADVTAGKTATLYAQTLAAGAYNSTIKGGGTLVLDLSSGITSTGTWTVTENSVLKLNGAATNLLSTPNAATVALNGGTLNIGVNDVTIANRLVLGAAGNQIVNAGGVLTLNGQFEYTGAVDNSFAINMNGSDIALGTGIEFLTGEALVADTVYILMTNVGTVTGLDSSADANDLPPGYEIVWSIKDGNLCFSLVGEGLTVLEWAAGGTMNLTDGTTGFVDSGVYADTNGIYVSTQDTDIVLSSAVDLSYLKVAAGITASLEEGSFELTLGDVVLEGTATLTLKDDALSADSNLAKSSATSTVEVDAAGFSLSYGEILDTYLGNLVVKAGALDMQNAAGSLMLASATVEAGASLSLGSTSLGSAGLSIAGSEAASVTTTVYVGSTTFSSAVTATGNATLNVAADSTTTLSSLTGSGTFIKTGAGTLVLSGDSTHSGTLHLQEGNFNFGTAQAATNALGFSEVILEAGTTFTILHGASSAALDVVFNGGMIYSSDGDIGGTFEMGTVTVNADSAFTHQWGMNYSIGDLTGAANLAISSASEGEQYSVNIEQMTDYSGTLSATTEPSVIINSINTGAGLTTTITGSVLAGTVTKTGEGSLNIETLTFAGGNLGMTIEGDATITNLNATISGVLSYNKDDTGYLDITNLTVSDGVKFTLELENYTVDDMHAGINLGIDSSIVSNDSFVIWGYTEDQYSIVEVDGKWQLVIDGDAGLPDFSIYWDENWGTSVLDGAPDILRSISPSASVALSESSAYYSEVNGVRVVSVLVEGGGTSDAPIDIIGGLSSNNNTTPTLPSESDVWIKVTGGNIEKIVGGNVANNWSSGSKFSFTGDTHIVFEGGEVGYIIGGTHRDGQAPVFTGNSYISVYDVVSGAIIGGNTSVHQGSPTFIGDTNIFVYVPQSSDSPPTMDTLTGMKGIWGGSVRFANSGSNMNHTGNTNVTIDLSEYSLAVSGNNFAGMVAGGSNCCYTNIGSVITGDTNVNIIGTEGVNFDLNVFGGNYSSSYGTCSITGTSSLNISGDSSFTQCVVAGSMSLTYQARQNVGATSLNISGGTFSADVIGGSMNGSTTENEADSYITVGNVDIALSGGTLTKNLYGGNYLMSASLGTVSVGDINISLDGTGSLVNLFGGSVSAGAATITQGNISLELTNGKMTGSAFAAGNASYAANCTYTTASTTVSVGSGFTFGELSIVSGGYYLGEQTQAGCTVTGNRTLKITDASYDNLNNVMFTDFDVVDTASGAHLDMATVGGGWRLQAFAETVTKTGEGKLSLVAGNTGNLDITAGTVALGAGTADTADNFSSITLRSGATLDLSAGNTSINGNLNIENGSTVILAVGLDGAVMGAGNSLTWESGAKLELSFTSALSASFDEVLFKDVDLDALSGITLEDLNGKGLMGVSAGTYIADDGSTWAINNGTYLYITDDGDLAISNSLVLSELTWDGGDNGVWNTGGTEGWLTDDDTPAESGFTINGAVVFDGTALTDVSVAAAGINATSVRVIAGDYTYTDGDLIISQVLEVTDGATATFENNLDVSSAGIKIGDNSTITISANDGGLTVNSFESTGSLSMAGKDFTINSVVSAGGSVSAANITALANASFTSLTVTEDVSVTGSLSLEAASSITGALSATGLTVTAGDVSIGSVTGELTSLSNGAGELSINSNLSAAGLNNVGHLTVGSNSLTLSGGTTAGGDVTAGSLTLYGTDGYTFDNLQVAGAVTNSNSATLSLGDASSITGNYSGGPLVILDDSVVYIGSNEAGMGSLDVGEGSTLTMGAKLFVGANGFVNDGEIIVQNNADVQINCATDAGGIISANNFDLGGTSYSFTQLIAAGDVTASAGSLTLEEGSSIDGTLTTTALTTQTGDTSIGALAAGCTSITNGTGTLTISSAVTTGSISNNGSLNLGANDLGLTGEGTSDAGVVTAGNVSALGDLSLGDGSSLTGAVSSANGDLSIGANSSVTLGASAGADMSIGAATTIGGSVTAGGDLTMGAGSSVTGSVGAASLTVNTLANGDVTLGSLTSTALSGLTNGAGALTINGTGSSIVSITDLNNAGTIDMAGYAVDITTVSAGGTLSVASLNYAASSSFAGLTSTGAVTGTGDLTVTSATSLGGLVITGGLSVNGATTISGTADVEVLNLSVNGNLNITQGGLNISGSSIFGSMVQGNLDVAGDVTTNNTLSVQSDMTMDGSTLNIGGALTVGGALSIGAGQSSVTEISVIYAATNAAPTITADSLAVSSAGLNILMDESHLNGLGMLEGNPYTLISLEGTSFAADVTLNGKLVVGVSTGGTYTISVVDGDIVLEFSMVGVTWSGKDWGNPDSTADWSGADGPSLTLGALFKGAGESNVTVYGEQEALSLSVNIEEGAANDSYTFEGVDEDASITTGTLSVLQGGAIIEMDLAVVAGMGSEETPSKGQVIVGSTDASAKDASLTVGTQGNLIAEILTINEDYNNVDGVITGFLNKGETSITTTVDAEGKTIGNEGSLSISGNGAIGSIVGAGTTAVTGEGALSLSGFDASGSLQIAEQATVSFTGDATLENLSNEGVLNVTGTLNAQGDLVAAGTVNAKGLTIGADTSYTVAGTTNVSEMDVLNGSLKIAEDGILNIAQNASIGALSNAGQINVDGSLTLTQSLSNGGDITADSIALSSARLGTVVTDALVLNSLSYIPSADTPVNMALLHSAPAGTQYVLEADSLNAKTSGGTIELSLAALGTDTADGQYYLIESTGEQAYSWDMFQLSDGSNKTINELITEVGKDLLFATTESGDLVLIVETADNRTWSTDLNYAVSPEHSDNDALKIQPIYVEKDGVNVFASYDVLNTVESVVVSQDLSVSLAGVDDADAIDKNVTINNLTGYTGRVLTLIGDNSNGASITLSNDKTTVAANKLLAKDLTLYVESETTDITLDNGDSASVTGSLTLAELELDGSSLIIADGANFTVGSLTGDDESFLSGKLNIIGSGTNYNGGYEAATVVMSSAAASATFDVSGTDANGLTLEGSAGLAVLAGASGGSINKIDTTGASISLGTISKADGDKGGALNVEENVSMVGGSLGFSISTSDLSESIANDASLVIIENATLNLKGTSIVVGQSDILSKTLDVGDAMTDIKLFQLSDNTAGTATGDCAVIFGSDLYNKYFTNGSYDASTGIVTADRNDVAYNNLAQTENGAAGLNLVSKALFELNPEASNPNGDLADVITSMDSYKAMGAYGAADALAAAVAGSSTTSLGSAAVSDVERQLRSIRNRTKMMGVDPSVVNEDMPYFNGWIAAEGGSSTLDADGTNAGHKLNNMGGSIGAEVDLNDMVSVGASFSALYGDLTGDGPDTAEGDFNTMYGSLFARVNNKRWTHSFVATFGAIDATLDRTVSTTSGPYKTKGETDGTAFGLMYEVGYTYALTEDASTCLQPIFNVALVNSSIGGYTETGSDAALEVGDQDNNYVTFGLGGLLETVVGENVYNRASVLSARAMMKFDAGDRQSEADVTIASSPNYTETVKGAEVGAVGIELGLGLTIPVTEEVGAIFMDVSCEFRSGMTNVNGSVGYRFSF